jgi:hypothetical protein
VPLCFEVRINDNDPVLAGLENIGVLTALVTYVSRSEGNELEIRVGGLKDRVHMDWVDQDLKTGDEVTIRIVDSENPAMPIRRTTEDEAAFQAEEERRYYEHLKKKYEPSS